jgi:hypothetical protein
MADRRSSAAPAPAGHGGTSAAALAAPQAPGGGRMWIGEHAADGDLLVFDPAQADPSADRLAFYSMTQLRTRVFPRAVVEKQIRELTDDLRSAGVKKDYHRRADLREARDIALASARADVAAAMREQVIQQHERYLAVQGITYQGVTTTPAGRKPSRRTRCHSCGIALDDFAESLCGVCSDVLCSCGACACASRGRRNR